MAIDKTIPFNFNEIYSFIEKKFEERGYDTEEGSNTMQLVTAMSYLTSMLNANTAVNVNELLLPLARKRNTILQDARVLGYEIEHRRSYQYILDLEFNNSEDEDFLQTFLKYNSFEVAGKTYYYMGEEFDLVVPGNGTATTSIIVIEGDLKRFTDPENDGLEVTIELVTDEQGNQIAQRFVDVPYTNVEENGLEVFLTYFDEFGDFQNQELWTKSRTFMIDKDTILKKEYVRLDDIDFRTPRIYFKLGDVGKEIRVGTIIQMNVLESSGKDGNIPAGTNPNDIKPVQLENVTVTGYRLELEGAEEESLESVKKNAPLFHNTANRVITKPDYIAFCNRLAKVEYTDVWDGHNEYPAYPGFIWFSFISSNISRVIRAVDLNNNIFEMQDLYNDENWFLDQQPADGTLDKDIEEIFLELEDYKVPTMNFFHRNPIFFDFEFTVNIVKYSAAKTRAQRNKLVFDVINNYFRGFDDDGKQVEEVGVETYNYEFFQSNLSKRIDEELTDLMGFNISLKTTLNLSPKNIIRRERGASFDAEGNPLTYLTEIRFHLGFPYEDVRDQNGDYVLDSFPKIETPNIEDGKTVWVDFDATPSFDAFSKITTFPVMLGTDIVGEYRIIDNELKDIEVIFYIISADGHSTGFKESTFSSHIDLDIQYASPNISFSRNTIPRLKRVNFI